jgi:hypothetical protein
MSWLRRRADLHYSLAFGAILFPRICNHGRRPTVETVVKNSFVQMILKWDFKYSEGEKILGLRGKGVLIEF